MIIDHFRRWGFGQVLTLGIVLLLNAACMSTNLPPISSYGQNFEPLDDERALWEEAQAEEELLLEHVTLHEDPSLEAYLEGVASRLASPGVAEPSDLEYRVRVIEDPSLNAFAYPHGSIYVHTGLLSKMENEDQLATVLAHEMTHVENRHMVRQHRSAHNKRVGWGLAAVAAAVVLAEHEWDAYTDGDWGRGLRIEILGDLFLGLGLELAIQASVDGYGRELEREADHGGLAKLSAAGYDPAEAAKVYQILLDDQDSRELPGVFFFSSHPKLSRRVESARAWLAENPGGNHLEKSQDEFLATLAPVLLLDARHRLEVGSLELAECLLARALAFLPEDREANLLMGSVRLARAEAEPSEAAGHRRRAEAHLRMARRPVVQAQDRP